jgi:fatty acid CoA ligase FadD9
MNTMTMPSHSLAERANAERFEVALKRLEATIRRDPATRQWAPLPSVIEQLQGDHLTAVEVLQQACAAYAERPALGERAFVLETTPAGQAVRFLPEFRTISFAAVWQRTVELATGLVRDRRTALEPGEVMGIIGFGSIDYVLADLACLYAGVTSAVLQMSMPAEDLMHIINEGRFAGIACTREGLPGLLEVLPSCRTVRSVVVMDLHEGATRETAELERVRAAAALPVLTLDEAAAQGRAAAPLAPWRPAAGTDPLATLMYTSGSTGFPKGALLTQRVWRSHWQLRWLTQLARFPSISLNFYPLSHAMGRNTLLRTLILGGVTHFTLASDMSTLFEDIRLVRPTFLNLVPRISEMFHQSYLGERQRLERTGVAAAEAGERVRAVWRGTFLGDRLTAAMIGSAPTAPETAQWLATCFEIPVYEGYGSTEAGVLSVDGMISRPTVSDYRLVEVPELGYRLSDKPYPRGELVVKTSQSIPGFFQNEAATRALYDDQGFLKTGDIVEERGPDQIQWVDRKNNVVKLAQGEYVTLWRLETLFTGGSPLLDQVYLYANSQRAYPLAVAVPEWTAVQERLAQADPPPETVKQLLRGEFNRIAGAAQLRPYEVPREILVEPEPWTRENGFLTGVNKPARPQLKQRYGERLEALYRQLEDQQRQDLAGLGQDPGQPLEARVAHAAAAVLGVPDIDLAAGSFRDLGGDSISALNFALLLEEICGEPVPAAALLNPGSTLLALVRQLEARRGRDALPSFGAIHGKDATGIRAEDLTLARLLDPGSLAEAAKVAAQPLAPVTTVLLTGANGFLGHVLCLEWLERMARAGGRVVALVRAADDQAAAARLEAAYRTGDARLPQRFATLAGERLTVLAGDLAAPRLGLAPEVYAQLAQEVDLIVHPGALVNHVYSYEQLFEPNVLGTAQLVRLALHGRRKRFDYVSSIGVLAGARGSGKVMEVAGVDALQSIWPASGGYAFGYATSKWAGEVLLKELHERFDAPVRVFRPGMILPDRRFRGQANVPDLLTRLLVSVVCTGLAPRSFYAGGRGKPEHYDGLPVDFIAAAMVLMSSAEREGHATYQVSNAHWDDGVSLDTLMDWVATAGYPIERVADHAAWFSAFGDRLRQLPAEQRQHSSLPILHQWAEPSPAGASERVDASRFSREVRRLRPCGEAGIPQLNEAFVHKYLADLRALGLLKS